MSLNHMRYWAFLAAKLLLAAVVLGGLLHLLNWGFDRKRPPVDRAAVGGNQLALPDRPSGPERTAYQNRGAVELVKPPSVPVILETEEQAAEERAQMGREQQRRSVPPVARGIRRAARFTYDLGFTLSVLIWFLSCVAVLYFVVWDQRYRCRVCLRRLRMPIETGSWSRMLQFGRPRIEYICTYGHGTLKEEEVQISGLASSEWTRHSDDVWEELCAPSQDPGDPS